MWISKNTLPGISILIGVALNPVIIFGRNDILIILRPIIKKCDIYFHLFNYFQQCFIFFIVDLSQLKILFMFLFNKGYFLIFHFPLAFFHRNPIYFYMLICNLLSVFTYLFQYFIYFCRFINCVYQRVCFIVSLQWLSSDLTHSIEVVELTFLLSSCW